MPTLTTAQKQTLKAFIQNTPVLAALAAAAEYAQLAAALNAASSFIVWKTRVTEQEMHAAYVWTEMDSLTQARFNSLSLLLKPGFLNPSIQNVRNGITDIFTGAQLANTRTALVALAKRFATVAEQRFASGTGTTGDPGLLGWEGTIVAQEMADVLAS